MQMRVADVSEDYVFFMKVAIQRPAVSSQHFAILLNWDSVVGADFQETRLADPGIYALRKGVSKLPETLAVGSGNREPGVVFQCSRKIEVIGAPFDFDNQSCGVRQLHHPERSTVQIFEHAQPRYRTPPIDGIKRGFF